MGLKEENNLIHFQLTTGFPLGLGKPGKMRRHFPVRGKSGNFEQSGKIREEFRTNHIKYWKI